MKKPLCALICLFILGCASFPLFQKRTGDGDGYTLEELGTKNNFRITLFLPAKVKEKFLRDYAYRAIGEECLARGLAFFDVADLTPTQFEGFCFATNTRKGQSIAFQKGGLFERKPRFIVEDLMGQRGSELRINDMVISIDGQPLTTTSQLKSLAYAAAARGKKTVRLSINRRGKTMTVEERLVDVKGSVFGNQELTELRKRVP